jgi:hypothetical protein
MSMAISTPKTLRRTHQLLTVQSAVVILLSINRLTDLTLAYVAQNQFLRWVDFNNMLVFPLISAVAFYLLKKEMEYEWVGWSGSFQLALNLTFIIGLYLLAASYGNHEVTNYLHTRFCLQDSSSDLCRIVIFNDDEFSHWIFFLGFVLMNAVIMLYPLIFPYPGSITRKDIVFLLINGLFIGLGVFANLAFEEIGLDLVVVALLALLAVGLLVRHGRQPLFIYYTTAYVFGLAATFIYKGGFN